MENVCLSCDKWKSKKAEALMSCSSVFDASDEIESFEEECSKTCPFKNCDNYS